MKFIFLLQIFTAISTFAQSNKECPAISNNNLDQLKKISEKIEWWAASDQQVLSSPCTKNTPYTQDEMLKWLSIHSSTGNKINAKFYGIELVNEDPKLVNALKDLLSSKDFFGDIDLKSQKTFKSLCKTAVCVAKEIFGKREGIQLMFMHERFGYNGSPFQYRASAWKADELDDVLLALSAFPDHSLPIESNARLVHFKRGYTYKSDINATTVANASIEVFDTWNGLPKSSKRSALVHELGHQFAMKMNADESPTWLEMGGWTKKTNTKTGEEKWTSNKQNSIVSTYAKSNPFEDFAESVVAYRYNPNNLKKISPEKYDFIKNTVFDGLEYTSSDTCNPKNANFNQRIAQTKAHLNEVLLMKSSPELKAVEKNCAKSQIDLAIKMNQKNANIFVKCISTHMNEEICKYRPPNNKNKYVNFSNKIIGSQKASCPPLTIDHLKVFVSQSRVDFLESTFTMLKKNRDKKESFQDDCQSWSDVLSDYNGQSTQELFVEICNKIISKRSSFEKLRNSKFSDEELKNALNLIVTEVSK